MNDVSDVFRKGIKTSEMWTMVVLVGVLAWFGKLGLEHNSEVVTAAAVGMMGGVVAYYQKVRKDVKIAAAKIAEAHEVAAATPEPIEANTIKAVLARLNAEEAARR